MYLYYGAAVAQEVERVAISVWTCVWMGERGKYCKALWADSRLVKHYKNSKTINHKMQDINTGLAGWHPTDYFHFISSTYFNADPKNIKKSGQ